MQVDFTYEPVCDGAGCQLAVTILADRDAVRMQMREDAELAGYRVLECCSLEEFASGSSGSLGDLVLVDCVETDGAAMALLSRLDMRAGKSGTRLVVSTSMAALDTVFGCFAMSRPEILVDPGHAERVIAIGRALAEVPNLRVREMAEEDRLMLLRLTEQVARMAERVEQLSPGQREGGGAFRLEAASQAWRAAGDEYVVVEQAPASPRLPEAAYIRKMISQRQARAKYFDADLLVRIPDPHDRRRAHIALADSTADAMARYFCEVGVGSAEPVAAL